MSLAPHAKQPSQAAAVECPEVADILGMDRESLEGFFTEFGERPFRARQVLSWLHKRGISDFQAMTDLAKGLRRSLAERTRLTEPAVWSEQCARDGTRKWLLGLDDGNAVETVFIPEADRGTLCISSQAGCPLDCKFCATGYSGFRRNLAASEIIAQVRHAWRELGTRLTNVVFMGMGEPLLNYESVRQTINLLLDDHAYGFSRRRVTVSTVGIVPRIHQLGRETPVNLAVSLHGVSNAVRDRIVPLNRSFPLERLLQACREYPLPKGRRITFEYVMLDGVNDSPEEAHSLAQLLKGIPAKVNLIPFNPFPEAEFECSPDPVIERFRAILLERGLVAVTRTPRGDDIAAACGQLKGEHEAPLVREQGV